MASQASLLQKQPELKLDLLEPSAGPCFHDKRKILDISCVGHICTCKNTWKIIYQLSAEVDFSHRMPTLKHAAALPCREIH